MLVSMTFVLTVFESACVVLTAYFYSNVFWYIDKRMLVHRSVRNVCASLPVSYILLTPQLHENWIYCAIRLRHRALSSICRQKL
jgi:hypothetical protein